MTAIISPTNLIATVTDTGHSLSWTDNSDNEHGFEIWVSYNGGSYSLLATTVKNVTTYVHTHSHQFYTLYKVRARTGSHFSNYTNVSTIGLFLNSIPTGLTLTLISGGVKIDWTDTSGGTANTEIWAKIDSGSYSLIYTINAGIVTKNDLRTEEDLVTYKLRTESGGLYSAFSSEQSIVMLGANLIPSASSDFITDGTGYWSSGDTISWNNGTHDMKITWVGGQIKFYRDNLPVIGKTYLCRFKAKSSNFVSASGFIVSNASSGTYTAINNPALNIIYVDYRFRGLQVDFRYLEIGTYDTSSAGKEITVDDIKLQEVLVP